MTLIATINELNRGCTGYCPCSKPRIHAVTADYPDPITKAREAEIRRRQNIDSFVKIIREAQNDIFEKYGAAK